MRPHDVSYRRTSLLLVLLGFFPSCFSPAQSLSEKKEPQTPRNYDVISIRVNDSKSAAMSLRNLPNGFIATNISLQLLLMNAFDTQPELIMNAPA